MSILSLSKQDMFLVFFFYNLEEDFCFQLLTFIPDTDFLFFRLGDVTLSCLGMYCRGIRCGSYTACSSWCQTVVKRGRFES